MTEETRENISEEEARSALSDKEKEAEKILQDEKETSEWLNKARKLLNKIKKIPVIGGFVDDITTTIDLIGDYVKGNYRDIPFRIIVSALAAIIYLVSPIDLFPDAIPFFGFVDDAAVIALVLSTGLSFELSKYRKWKKDTERVKIIKENREKYEKELDEQKRAR